MVRCNINCNPYISRGGNKIHSGQKTISPYLEGRGD